MQLFSHIEYVYSCLSKGDDVDVIYLEYSKAFDKAIHRILLAMISRYDKGEEPSTGSKNLCFYVKQNPNSGSRGTEVFLPTGH